MRRWPLKYHLSRRNELEAELFELCHRLRRPPERRWIPMSRTAGPGPDREERAARRCYIAPGHCADFDLPRVLEADEQVCALLRALNEAALLLYFFTKGGRYTDGNRRLPS